MADLGLSDKRLLQRSMAQRHRSDHAPAQPLESLPDLSDRLRTPEPAELEALAKELEIEHTARAERIRRAAEQRAAGPVVAPRAIPVPFDENDL